MNTFAVLTVLAYLLGSVPAGHIITRLFLGVDLRQLGTGQPGTGNVWRLTSWRYGLPVAVFDISKGMVMVWAAQAAGLGIAQQVLVGTAAVAGHSWSVFLRFNGGRGMGTAAGVLAILPVINPLTPWPTLSFFIIGIGGWLIFHTSPVSSLLGILSVPLLSWLFGEPDPVTLSLAALPLVIILRRLTAPLSAEGAALSKGALLYQRFLFDRDIKDSRAWMYRRTAEKSGDKPG